MVSSSVIMFAVGSRNLMVVKSLWCFDSMLTSLSDLAGPNSTVTGVVYQLFSNFTSVSYTTSWCWYSWLEVVLEMSDVSFLPLWGRGSGFALGLEGFLAGDMITVRDVWYST